MTWSPRFELIPLSELKIHEEIDASDLERLVERIRADGQVNEPLLVAEQDHVILNGHHRYAALRALGARWAPAWVVDYESAEIQLDRWTPGPPIAKVEVVQRARTGQPFPPKTTRHRLSVELPAHPTPLEDLGSERPRVGNPAGRR
jgi:hypothetical protein